MKYLSIILLLFSITTLSYAEDEVIELTTYYPAPYGEYDELQGNKLAVGSTAIMPTTDGAINFSTVNDSIAEPVGAEGDIYYSGKDSEFKYHDGSASSPWKTLGGSSGVSQLGDYEAELTLGPLTTSDPVEITPVLASTDGFVVAYSETLTAHGCIIEGYTDSNPDPATLIAQDGHPNDQLGDMHCITFPVKKGNYWKIRITKGDSRATYRWISFQ